MMNERVMIITGSSRGIGRYLAECYLQRGFLVIGCSRTSSDLVNERYEHYSLDVSNEKAVCEMISEISLKYKRIDYMINNAGIASMNHSLLTPLDTVEKVMKTNFFGTFLFCRETAKVMSKNRFGRIVNFSTVAVPYRLEGEAIYASSKAAVEMFTKVFAKEIAHMGITVNAIGPSPAETDLIKNVPKKKIDSIIEKQAIKHFTEKADILNVIDFFLDDKSSMISGQIIYLGGIS